MNFEVMNPMPQPSQLYEVARCNAKTRSGGFCQQPGMKNGRCRLHGGKSTGPRTPEGLERSRKANWKHGFYSAEAKNQRKAVEGWMRESKNCFFSG